MLRSGFLAAILAATLQFVMFAGVMPQTANQSAARALSAFNPPICTLHASTGDHSKHDAACLLCPICLAFSLPAMPAPPPPRIAPPRLLGLVVLPETESHFPAPPPKRAAAYPRGPPLI
jgi:hypothetical protein